MDCPSTPAAPRFAFTCLHASHTSRFAIQNGLALFMRVLPFRVAHRIKPDDDAPSVQSHYRTFFPITDVSAPVPRVGTQTYTWRGASRPIISARLPSRRERDACRQTFGKSNR